MKKDKKEADCVKCESLIISFWEHGFVFVDSDKKFTIDNKVILHPDLLIPVLTSCFKWKDRCSTRALSRFTHRIVDIPNKKYKTREELEKALAELHEYEKTQSQKAKEENRAPVEEAAKNGDPNIFNLIAEGRSRSRSKKLYDAFAAKQPSIYFKNSGLKSNRLAVRQK